MCEFAGLLCRHLKFQLSPVAWLNHLPVDVEYLYRAKTYRKSFRKDVIANSERIFGWLIRTLLLVV